MSPVFCPSGPPAALRQRIWVKFLIIHNTWEDNKLFEKPYLRLRFASEATSFTWMCSANSVYARWRMSARLKCNILLKAGTWWPLIRVCEWCGIWLKPLLSSNNLFREHCRLLQATFCEWTPPPPANLEMKWVAEKKLLAGLSEMCDFCWRISKRLFLMLNFVPSDWQRIYSSVRIQICFESSFHSSCTPTNLTKTTGDVARDHSASSLPRRWRRQELLPRYTRSHDLMTCVHWSPNLGYIR